MKKSNLKYVFLTLLICTIYSLYHYNKKYFDSSDSVYKKNSKRQSSGGGIAFSSGSDGGSFNMSDVSESNNVGVEIEGSSSGNNNSESNSNMSSGFSSQGGSFSSSYSNQENQSSNSDNQEMYEHATITNAQQSNNNSSDGMGLGTMPTMAIGVPTINDRSKEEEEEKREKEVSSNQTAGGRSKFFETVSNSGGSIDLPMAPSCPDCEVPLDGGASLLLILGSLAGVKKLFFNKSKSA